MSRARWASIGAAVLGAIATLGARSAHADPRDLCLAPYDGGQELRHRGKLREARDVFRTCARDTCPSAVRVDCATWEVEVAAAIPTLIVRARDDRGRDVTHVTVSVDGTPVVAYEEGRPFEIDPGEHTLRLEAPAGRVDLQVVAREGEKGRVVSATFSESATPSSRAPTTPSLAPVHDEPPRRPIPASVWALGGVGVVGLASFATLGLIGLRTHGELRGTCAPHCTDDQTRPIRIEYAIGDISLATSIVAFGVATALFFTRPPARSTKARVVPWIGPAFTGVAGAFE